MYIYIYILCTYEGRTCAASSSRWGSRDALARGGAAARAALPRLTLPSPASPAHYITYRVNHTIGNDIIYLINYIILCHLLSSIWYIISLIMLCIIFCHTLSYVREHILCCTIPCILIYMRGGSGRDSGPRRAAWSASASARFACSCPYNISYHTLYHMLCYVILNYLTYSIFGPIIL